MKFRKIILYLFLTLSKRALLIHRSQNHKKLYKTVQSPEAPKHLQTQKREKNLRKLELIPTGEKYLKRYAETMDLQSNYLKQVMGLISRENTESKLDEMGNDDLAFFEERKEDVLKKIGGVKNQLQQRLGEFYTKYIQMPMMGNFSYWDLTNPASLH